MSIVSKLPFADQLRTTVFFLRNLGGGAEQLRVLKLYLAAKLTEENRDETHLKAAMDWLARAQDFCRGDGVSSVFCLKNGWGVAYPETSGYIIATYLAYSDYSGYKSYVERAVRIGD